MTTNLLSQLGATPLPAWAVNLVTDGNYHPYISLKKNFIIHDIDGTLWRWPIDDELIAELAMGRA